MADIFGRYHRANEIVEVLPDGPNKEGLRKSVAQLLHIEQGRLKAVHAHQKYLNDMNEWENNILHFIESEARKARGR